MKYAVLIASIAAAAALAAPATSQTLAPQDAAAIGADASAPIPSADARAADLDKTMEIRGW